MGQNPYTPSKNEGSPDRSPNQRSQVSKKHENIKNKFDAYGDGGGNYNSGEQVMPEAS
jgi:hypothetical protein